MPPSFPKVVQIGGRDYTFELTVAAHRRVKAACGVSLPDCVSDVSEMRTKEEREHAMDGFRKLMGDFDLLPKVVAAMIAPQLAAAGIDAEQFEDMLTGPVLIASSRAITQALIDFFHDDPRGKLLAGAVEMQQKAAKVQDQWTAKAQTAMNRKLTEMETAVSGIKGDEAADAMIREASTTLSTTLPESLASILGLSPSPPLSVAPVLDVPTIGTIHPS